ncbi:hypothetical protein M0R45_034496 [Rubus argutus]|uniref:Uncharacterized protein n=1 Tax=Rubus argutus TaxID=59490 RepID=A0AAW1VQA3_RUBAR
MGGGEHAHGDGHGAHGGDFRAKVWSMSGGPYCRPKHWKRNTAPPSSSNGHINPFAQFLHKSVCKNFGKKDY